MSAAFDTSRYFPVTSRDEFELLYAQSCLEVSTFFRDRAMLTFRMESVRFFHELYQQDQAGVNTEKLSMQEIADQSFCASFEAVQTEMKQELERILQNVIRATATARVCKWHNHCKHFPKGGNFIIPGREHIPPSFSDEEDSTSSDESD